MSAARVGGARLALPQQPSFVELPWSDRPQVVDEDGYELTDEEVRALAEASGGAVIYAETNGNTGGEEDGLEDGLEMGEAEEEEEEEEDAEDEGAEEENGEENEEAEGEEEEAEEREQLLSVADSLVLPYSLLATRQHHLHHLLPRIFAHPPVPSHSKPRARPPLNRPLFEFPTPPPPPLPLPSREYHGPLPPKPSAAVPVASPSPSASPAPAPAPDQAEGSKAKKRPPPPATAKEELETDPPAHEIECVSRCTLSLGPVSFPGSELWVGRFVEPRLAPLMPLRTKKERDKERRAKRDRSSMAAGDKPEGGGARKKAEGGGKKRPRLSGEGKPPAVRPPPPPQRPTPMVMPPPPGSVRPPAPAPAARPNIAPELIQRVNQAATQHPWLSIIIHKAARNQASREELAKLGRVVGRLTRGEPIGEEAPAPPPPPPPAAAAATPAPVPSVVAAEGNNAEDSDSDLSSIDMKGEPQEGGGPVDPALINPPAAASSPAPAPADPGKDEPPIVAAAQNLAPASVAEASPVSPAPPARPTPPHFPLPQHPPSHPSPSHSPAPPPTIAPSSAVPLQTGTASIGSTNATPPSLTSTFPSYPLPPPPPPRYTGPMPPPFLLVAFQQHPTDKFLIPLGRRSYISRVGGDHVTHPPPPPPPSPPPTPPPAPVPHAQEAEPAQPIPAADTAPAAPIEPSKPPSRSRTSLARGAKLPPPAEKAPTPAPELVPEPIPAPPVVEPVKKARPESGLPPLPGTKPSPGIILISTFIPSLAATQGWQKPDWKQVRQGLPWNNKGLFPKPGEPFEPPLPAADGASKEVQEVKEEVMAEMPKSPARPKRPARQSSAKTASTRAPGKGGVATGPDTKQQEGGDEEEEEEVDGRPRLLNFAAADFLPHQGSLQAVTLRLEGVDDRAWARIKAVMKAVEAEELVSLAERKPQLTADNPPDTTKAETLRSGQIITHALREQHVLLKRQHFARLIRRTCPSRHFLKLRLSAVPPEIRETLADKWHPRPYPLSTRPLYTRSPPPDDEDGAMTQPQLSPEKKGKKGAGAAEEETVYEMPVDLGGLDERVEEGASRLVQGGKRGNKKGGAGGGAGAEDGKKRYGKRAVEGRVCEGCAGLGLKVWRRGPSGPGTLCNACGDLYAAGNLGELKAPGAANVGLVGKVEAAGGEEGEERPDGGAEKEAGDVKLEDFDRDEGEGTTTHAAEAGGVQVDTAQATVGSAAATDPAANTEEPVAEEVDNLGSAAADAAAVGEGESPATEIAEPIEVKRPGNTEGGDDPDRMDVD